MTTLKSVRGTKDLIGQDVELYNIISHTTRELAARYCYDEIIVPIFEYSEVFHRTLGDASDIISKETYTFTDRDKSSITLRPEFTASIVRAFLSNNLSQDLPQRLFSIGPLFRHERPQFCRYRQFHQLNFEFLGGKTFNSDIETLCLAHDILTKLNLRDLVQLEINTIGDCESRAGYKKSLGEYLNAYKSKLSEQSLYRLSKNPLRILDSKDEADKEVLVNAPQIIDHLNAQSMDHYCSLLEMLNALGAKYIENPKLVRGMDYYTHTVFEFTTDKLGAQNAVLAGGRYDNLSKLMGGPDVEGIGFASGIERLAALMEINHFTSISKELLYIVPIGDENNKLAIEIASSLRNAGLSCRLDFGLGLKKRMQQANKIGASYAIIFGDEEVSASSVKVKNMIRGEEHIIHFDRLVEYALLLSSIEEVS